MQDKYSFELKGVIVYKIRRVMDFYRYVFNDCKLKNFWRQTQAILSLTRFSCLLQRSWDIQLISLCGFVCAPLSIICEFNILFSSNWELNISTSVLTAIAYAKYRSIYLVHNSKDSFSILIKNVIHRWIAVSCRRVY